jgi:hypothetical protein
VSRELVESTPLGNNSEKSLHNYGPLGSQLFGYDLAEADEAALFRVFTEEFVFMFSSS